MPTVIKMCGITTPDALREAGTLGCAYVGFVFYPASPRHLELKAAAMLRKEVPAECRVVAVTVDAGDATIDGIVREVSPYALQLHGGESPARLAEIRAKHPAVKLIKALKVDSSDDIAKAPAFTDVSDMLMFDARAPKHMLPGGNGLSFDWALLKGREFARPWFLSGGLSADNVRQAITLSGAKMVDVSSSLESAPGVKDPVLMREFVKAVGN